MSKISDIDRLRYNKYAELAEESLLFYTCYMFKALTGEKFIRNWHHDKICEHLQAVYDGDIQYLLINMPPGYSKTLLSVNNFISWSFGLEPSCKFIHSSYSQDLALRNSNDTKAIIRHDEYQKIFPNTIINKKIDSSYMWETSVKGGMYSVSAGGAMTGFHAGRKNTTGFYGGIVIDDPHKVLDAESEVERDKILRWFKGTLWTRKSLPKRTPIIVIMQRLHEKDLSGFLLDGGMGVKFEHLCIPALDEKGNALWSFMHSERDLLLLKETTPQEFAGQYQQQPAPEEGGLYKDKYWNWYNQGTSEEPPYEYKIMTCDTAVKDRAENDFSVFQTWGKYLNRAYLIDQVRVKIEGNDLYEVFLAAYEKHKPRICYVEDAQSGSGLIQKVKKDTSIPVVGVAATKNKEQRARDNEGFLINRLVYLPKQQPWMSDYLTEHRNFPNADHDDQVDCTNLGVRMLLSENGIIVYPEFKSEFHVKENVYNKKLPLLISINTVGTPSFVFAQLTPFGQLRILDGYSAEEGHRETFIDEIKNKQFLEYQDSLNNFLVYTYKENKVERNPFDWDTLINNKLGRFPRTHDISKMLNDCIEQTAKALTDVVVNPTTQEHEKKITIDPKCIQLIKAFEGGLRREIPKKQDGILKPEIKIVQEYPYTNIGNSMHQMIYEVLMAQRKDERKKVKKEIKIGFAR